MAKPKRDLLEVLRLELEFLKNGGYRNGSSARRRNWNRNWASGS
jgi:hypothetical protein